MLIAMIKGMVILLDTARQVFIGTVMLFAVTEKRWFPNCDLKE